MIVRLYPIVLVLALWEVVTRFGFVDPFLLPAFSSAIKSIAANSDVLVNDALVTLWRAFAGLLVGAIAGLLIGTLMAASRHVNDFFDPLIAAIFPTPKLALYPLLMTLLGLGEASKIALIALSAFFPVVVNTYSGMRGVDKFLIWNAMSKGANAHQVLLKVMLPAALPFIFTGLRVATAFSFLLAIASEFLSANSGLGFRLIYAQRMFDSETMYAALLVIAALGFIVDRLLKLITQRMLAWQDTRDAA